MIDPTKPKEISLSLRKIISNGDLWEKYSKNGIMNVHKYYTWKSHAEVYAGVLHDLMASNKGSDMDTAVPSDAIGRRLMALRYFLVTDIDNTLIGEDNSRLGELLEVLEANREQIGFGIATGRSVDSAIAVLAKHNLPRPDVMICSVGSEIYYGSNRQFGKGWATHISHKWRRDRIVSLLEDYDFLEYQEEETQREFKISYYMEPDKERLSRVHERLLSNRCRYNLIYSHGQYLDILPYRASKGKAIRYLSYKWIIPLRNFLISGDSGNDEEMLRGEPRGVVVGNYSGELEELRGHRRIFFAQAPCAGGILEGMAHYRFIDQSGQVSQ